MVELCIRCKLQAKAPANATSAISKIDQGFADLKKAIDNKASNDDVTSIVHGTIVPNLQAAFNLQVIPEFPLPLLMIIPACWYHCSKQIQRHEKEIVQGKSLS